MARLLASGTGRPLSDHWGVLVWRYDELRKAGYEKNEAAMLAESDCDLHLACSLLERGCPPERALEILR